MAPPAALAYSGSPTLCAARARALGLEPIALFTGSTVVDKLMLAAVGGTFATVVVDRIGTLGARPLDALKVAAQIGSLGVRVEAVDPSEQWISLALPALTDTLDWLDRETRRWRVAAIRASAVRNNRRPGRPRKTWDTGVALALVERMPLERAARELGVGASTLRRWLQARTEEQKLASLDRPPGRAA